MPKDRILVTGGAGFIGSHLVEALVQMKQSVRVLDNFSTGSSANLDAVIDKIDLIDGDLRSRPDVDAAIRGCKRVVHLGALPAVPRSIDAPLEAHASNVDGTLTLLDAARAAKVKRFVYVGSGTIYGDAPGKESAGPAPLSPQAVSKLGGEAYALLAWRQDQLPVVCLRLFNTYGPRQDPDSGDDAVIPMFLRAVRRREPFPIHGDGRQQRDFTYVDDAVQAILAALNKAKAVGQIVNVASGKAVTVQEVARLTARAASIACQVKFMPDRAGDIRKSQADLKTMKRILGISPKTPLAKGIERTFDWFKSQHAA